MAVLHLNTDNFNQTVSSGKVMVDFWAPWCMPCQSLLPVIDELGEELAGKATVAKVNVDDNKAIASQFRVMSIPTVIFFVDGVEKERLIGVQPKQKYTDTLNSPKSDTDKGRGHDVPPPFFCSAPVRAFPQSAPRNYPNIFDKPAPPGRPGSAGTAGR